MSDAFGISVGSRAGRELRAQRLPLYADEFTRRTYEGDDRPRADPACGRDGVILDATFRFLGNDSEDFRLRS
jgi:hypothetical protein